ncbi:polysaccharide biosynthesis protein, partial [Candidatus Pelagibacter sp.]|nr:polysaccharide biosynthesis protein [Candidatus Pelagibacter sp.]
NINFFKKIIDDCHANGTKAITLASRGEPTLHPKLPEMLDYVSNEAANFVNMCILKMNGSEVFIPKIPSYKILDLVKAINPEKKIKFIGIRPGEKIHEELIEASDSNKIIESKNYFIINFSQKPRLKKTISKHKNFNSYNSLENSEFLSIAQIRKEIKKNIEDFD